eukprot:1832061-Rhodomonas_salina.1
MQDACPLSAQLAGCQVVFMFHRFRNPNFSHSGVERPSSCRVVGRLSSGAGSGEAATGSCCTRWGSEGPETPHAT